jgi:hypothetical protein
MKKAVFFSFLAFVSIFNSFEDINAHLTGLFLPAPGYRENNESRRVQTIGKIDPNGTFLTYAQKLKLANESLQFKRDAALVNQPHNMQGRLNDEPVYQSAAMRNQQPVDMMEAPTPTPTGAETYSKQTSIYNRTPVYTNNP